MLTNSAPPVREGAASPPVAVGDGGEALEAHVAVDMVFAPEDHLGGGPGERRHLLDESPQQSLVGLSSAPVVLEADERPSDEGVGGGAVGELEVRRLVAVQEGADLVEGAKPFGAKCHDHPPMISSPRTSGSSPAGNRNPVQAHLPWDKTPPSPSSPSYLTFPMPACEYPTFGERADVTPAFCPNWQR